MLIIGCQACQVPSTIKIVPRIYTSLLCISGISSGTAGESSDEESDEDLGERADPANIGGWEMKRGGVVKLVDTEGGGIAPM